MFERKNIARIWGTAKIGLVLVFVWLTNTGFMERLDLLLSQGRYRASFLFIALWCFCVTCLLLVAFQKQARWRFFWAVVIAVTTFFGYAFMRISDSQLTVYHVFSLWTARADAERAASFYTDQIIIAAAVALFGFIFLAARPPRFAPLLEKYISALRFAPAVPLAALVLMITVRIGDDTAAMPQQFVPAAIGFVAGAKLMVHEPPRKAALARSPTRQAAARHIVLIVDESVGVDYISREPGSLVTPFFAQARDMFVDFGVASSGSNCSANSNAIMRFGAGRNRLRETLSASPYFWEYAHKAGFRTVMIDAAASHIKNTSALQNFMTVDEKAMIDEFILIEEGPSPYLDLKASERIADILSRTEPHFIFVNKNGAHFPYERNYPETGAPFRSTAKNSSNDDAYVSRVNSYKNAIHWSVDVFFKDLIGRSDISQAAILYTSDHGQNLKSGNLSSCSDKNADASEGRVPMLFLSGIDTLRRRFARGAEININKTSHFAIFPTLIELFGYDREILGRNYGASLLGKINAPQEFVSGDLFGIFRNEIYWNAIRGRPEITVVSKR